MGNVFIFVHINGCGRYYTVDWIVNSRTTDQFTPDVASIRYQALQSQQRNSHQDVVVYMIHR